MVKSNIVNLAGLFYKVGCGVRDPLGEGRIDLVL
jgi:hypothetical protein